MRATYLVVGAVLVLGTAACSSSQSSSPGQNAPSSSQQASTSQAPHTPASATPPSTGSSSGTTLTAKNNKDLAALLKVSDNCSPTIKTFAVKYAGRDIEFDGSISALNSHGSDKTLYDIGIAAGNKGSASTVGPSFQFQGVNTTNDLHYKGSVPDTIGTGTKLHIVAKVGSFNGSQCLFQLTPVSTSVG